MDKKTQKILFSSKSIEQETPQEFFEKYNKIYNFTLDAAASDNNAKCRKYYTKQNNGLDKDWQGERVWVNPPYSRQDSPKWAKKIYEEGQKPNTLVCALLPARTSTKWFSQYITKAKELHFIIGRLKFGGSKTGAPFPSVVAIFYNDGQETELKAKWVSKK